MTGSSPEAEPGSRSRTRSARRTPQPTRCHERTSPHRSARRLARHGARTGFSQTHRPPALACRSTNETPGDGLEELRRPTSTVLSIRSGRNTRRIEYASPPVTRRQRFGWWPRGRGLQAQASTCIHDGAPPAGRSGSRRTCLGLLILLIRRRIGDRCRRMASLFDSLTKGSPITNQKE